MKFQISMIRLLGAFIIVLSFALVFLLVSFLNMIGDMAHASCTCTSCDMVEYETPPVFYLGVAVTFMLLAVGIYLVLKTDTFTGPPDRSGHWKKALAGLEGDEKAVYSLIMASDGTLFQSEVVEKTGLGKVKVTRVLDRLESRGLLERRRRGLTNIVLLK